MSVNRKSELQLALEALGHDPMPDQDGRVSLRIDGDSQTVWNLAWDIARTNSHLNQDAPIIDNCMGSVILTWREDYFDEDETDDEEDEDSEDDEEEPNTWPHRALGLGNKDDKEDDEENDFDPPDGSDEMGDELS